MQSKDLDIHIEEYAEGKISESKRIEIEARMKTDAAFKERVQTATQSVSLLRQALSPVEPKKDFEEKVTSQILHITQSNANLKGIKASHGGALTSGDPDASLLSDPEAERQRRRLVTLAIFTFLFFVGALVAIIALLMP